MGIRRKGSRVRTHSSCSDREFWARAGLGQSAAFCRAQPQSPARASVTSQGRQPLGQGDTPKRPSPGRGGRSPVAPAGAWGCLVTGIPRGSRPWLLTVVPAGLRVARTRVGYKRHAQHCTRVTSYSRTTNRASAPQRADPTRDREPRDSASRTCLAIRNGPRQYR